MSPVYEFRCPQCSDESDHVCADELEIRAKIAQEIEAIDMTEAKISSDYYAASKRMQMVCAAIARGK